MKIIFDIIVADSFDESGMWPIASEPSEFVSPKLDFEPGPVPRDFPVWKSWNLQQAEANLAVWVVDNYPGKKYKIYYWHWV